MVEYTIHTDGLCSPNPGTATWAYTAFAGNETLFHQSGVLEGKQTNNCAEYHGVLNALQHIQPDDKVTLYTDSQLVLNQISGAWQCNIIHLRTLRDRCRLLLQNLPNVKMAFVKGTENEADELTREAFREATGAEPINYANWKKNKAA